MNERKALKDHPRVNELIPKTRDKMTKMAGILYPAYPVVRE